MIYIYIHIYIVFCILIKNQIDSTIIFQSTKMNLAPSTPAELDGMSTRKTSCCPLDGSNTSKQDGSRA
jgi:hypothetical protein